MWLKPEFARTLLVAGLLLSALAYGGNQISTLMDEGTAAAPQPGITASVQSASPAVAGSPSCITTAV